MLPAFVSSSWATRRSRALQGRRGCGGWPTDDDSKPSDRDAASCGRVRALTQPRDELSPLLGYVPVPERQRHASTEGADSPRLGAFASML